MAGTVAHVLHIDFEKAVSYPLPKLSILYNEASRQRGLNAQFQAMSQDPKATKKAVDSLLKIHGPYTKGFHKRELGALKERLGIGKL